MLDVVGGFLVDTVLAGVFYWPGKLILRVATLGRYPPHKREPHNVMIVACVGLGSAMAILAFAFS